jgi:hypothetical protein
MMKNGTLKPHLIKVVRDHATYSVDEDEDDRWAVVKKLSDTEVWDIIHWCSYDRGGDQHDGAAGERLGEDRDVGRRGGVGCRRLGSRSWLRSLAGRTYTNSPASG